MLFLRWTSQVLNNSITPAMRVEEVLYRMVLLSIREEAPLVHFPLKVVNLGLTVTIQIDPVVLK